MDYFKSLPSEITLDILTRVPAESIPDCKSVCKNWRRLVHHPSFSKMHLNRHNHPSSDSGKLGFVALTWNDDDTVKFWYFDYNDDENQSTTPIERIRRINFTSPLKDTRFVGSSNGLICLSSDNDEPHVCICNPITREYVVLPQITTDSDIGIHLGRVIRFGYVTSSNEYKVVQICHLTFDEVKVHIYTLGSGTGWRNLGYFFCEIDLYDGTSVANGALYWMAIGYKMIITFDLSEEKFCQNCAPPPLLQDSNWENNKTGVLNGYLCFAAWLNIEGADYYDIWLLKKKNDYHDAKEQEVHQSMVWNREFRIHETNFLAVTKTGGVLTYMENYLNIYDPQASTSKMLVDFKDSFHQVFPHKNTLVSLKELGEQDTTTMESVEGDD